MSGGAEEERRSPGEVKHRYAVHLPNARVSQDLHYATFSLVKFRLTLILLAINPCFYEKLLLGVDVDSPQ